MPAMKLLFDGEWARVRPMLNRRFGRAAVPVCELCRKASCATHWYSVKRKAYRCEQCFTPEMAKKC